MPAIRQFVDTLPQVKHEDATRAITECPGALMQYMRLSKKLGADAGPWAGCGGLYVEPN